MEKSTHKKNFDPEHMSPQGGGTRLAEPDIQGKRTHRRNDDKAQTPDEGSCRQGKG